MGKTTVKIAMIAAMADDRVIGINNSLPWKLPNDMKWFRQQTMGKPIVMGRKTFESFGAKPLPGRTNIIITRDTDYAAPDCLVVHSVAEAIDAAGAVDEVMIIGGASFYEQMLPHADRLYLTFVHTMVMGDAWFPAFDMDEWREIERHEHPADEKNPHSHTFVILERNK
ncbi:MAG: type 3 dihydrofolate reductase [Gammaproteobacteria bacterium]|nr:type 3 dihydrofolate reductase [Gammaproteobacteria bacterium]MDH5652467.1 type 3 dihydrofolate reductase [Gammaproteobacteria bacterium]